ncbi:alginate export family protein [Rhizobium tumorigenes]|uniref:Alginate export family protein n=1 Tax=Rhizobium tumorigenes TaxID=2041385 RepID=A0AAF1KW59_9HYPH|nr:alginate export family protein [Rhizobium tumorigenes]WFR97916.1 alginate export family protein [Rhizobium tumorigenes]
MTRTQSATAARKATGAAAAAAIVLLSSVGGAWCANADQQTAPKRPPIKTNRWQEDWSALADPALKTQPLDRLKYVPIGIADPQSYVSFGATVRERFESNGAPSFGIGGVEHDSYLLQRAQIHADFHINENWQLFTQLEDVRAFDKTIIGGADQNRFDLRLAFLAYADNFESGTFKARVGRQDFSFDLQRFVSSRDGPNVRQSFDAIWVDWETGPWRFIGFVSQPVQYKDERDFDDTSNDQFHFSTLRVERQVLGKSELSAYYSLYQKDVAHFLDGSGDEQRHILDTRFAGADNGFDWDLEAMGQAGTVGSKDIRAWAAGARVGYTFEELGWTPRIGMQADIASGDPHPGDQTVGTFNPLFPNGYYFSLAGYTGYANLMHLKPSVTIKPTEQLTLTGAVGLQWRQTTKDAVYVQPNIPVPGTAGHGESWTGVYTQLRADYAFNANLTGAIEAVHYDAGETIRHAGGHNSNYLGAELKASW